MKITVVGHLCLDHIHTPRDRDPRKQFGGIIYAVATLAHLASSDDTIVPVFGVGNSDRDELLEQLSRYPNVDPSGIFSLDGPTNEVHLFYDTGGAARTECSLHIAPPISFEALKPHLATDALLINMISGSDITLETLDRVRMETRDRGTPIHFDFHALTLGVNGRQERFRRALSDWRRWCFMMHTIQMSEEEAAGLTAERYDEDGLVNQLMPLMVNTLIITRADRGATVITQKQKKLTRRDLPAVRVDAVDPTGCGDVFGAAFLFKDLATHDPFTSAEFANRVAAFKATVSGSAELERIPEYLKQSESA